MKRFWALIVGAGLLAGCATHRGGGRGPAAGAGADPNWGNNLETRGIQAQSAEELCQAFAPGNPTRVVG